MQEHSPAIGGDGLFALVRVQSQQVPTGNSLVKEESPVQDDNQMMITITSLHHYNNSTVSSWEPGEGNIKQQNSY